MGYAPAGREHSRDFPLALPTMTVLTPQVGVAILPVVKSIYLNGTDTGKVTRGPGQPSRTMSPYHPITTDLTLTTDQWHPGPWEPAAMHLSSPPPQQSTQPPPPPRQAPLGHVGDSAGRGRSQALLQSHSLPSSKDPSLGMGRHLEMGAQPCFHRGDGAGFLDADC